MNSKKVIIGIIIVAIVLFVGGYFLTNSKPTIALETTTIRVGDWPAAHGLPFYMAMEKGYFKDAGLNVEYKKFEAPTQIIDAIMNGQVDITAPSAALGITAIANHKNPGKLSVYAISGGTSGNSGSSFVTLTNSNLNSLTDLRNKKLGIPAGTIQWRTIAREVLSQNGLDMDKDLTIVEIVPALQVQALASGQIDALLAIEPIPTIVVNKLAAKVLLSDPTVKYISDPSWYGAGIVNVEFAKNNPKTTEKFISILNKSIDEVNNSPVKYRQYLKGYTSLTDDLINTVPLASIKVCGQINNQDRESIQKFFDLFTKYKVVDGKMNVQDVLYCK